MQDQYDNADSIALTRSLESPAGTRRLVRAPLPSSWRGSSAISTVGFGGEERFQKAVLFFTLLCTIVWIFIWLAEAIAQDSIVPGNGFVPMGILTGVGILLFASQRRHWRWANHLYTAVAFQVFVSAMITYSQLMLPSGMELRMGDSSVAAWIVFFATFVSMPPKATGIGSFGSALLVPVLPLLVAPEDFSSTAALAGLLIWSLPSFGMATWVIWLSKRHDQLVREAQDAKDLGSYRLIRRIGRGGMGEVWQARHNTLVRDAAIKLVRPNVMASQSQGHLQVTMERFRREASIIASLRSPHTVQLYDFGVALDGTFYYVMELLPGLDFQQLVHRFGALPPARAISFLNQACRSLSEAHAAGIVHRDIKPSNLFVSRLGKEADFVKVLDFGLARRDSADLQQLTAAGSLAGTPAYLAPEVLRGAKNSDVRSDIYALGCVAYYLLTGVPVFEENDSIAVALAHLEKEPCPMSVRADRQIPEDLERVVMRCLAKDPERRFRSADELAAALMACSSSSDWTDHHAQQWWDLHGASMETTSTPSTNAALELAP